MKPPRTVVFLFLCLVLSNRAVMAQRSLVKVFPDSVINNVSNHPIGINLNFLMDGGRFPNAERSLTEAIADMGVSYLRYPGGEKSDLYLFSVHPYQRSMPALARTAGIEDYPGVISDGKFTFDPLDFDEFITVCHSVGAEPVVVVAADNYLREAKDGESVSSRGDLIRHAVEWVKYANVWKKYNVRYWMIGNESWNANNPNSTAAVYAQDVIDFSRAMKAVDPSILIVPNGASDEFFKTVITMAGDHIDRVCVSNYGVYDFTRGYDTYRDSSKVLIWPAMTAMEAVEKYATPAQKERLKVIVAEYGTIDWARRWEWDNDMGHAIVNFDMTGQLLMEEQIEFSCFWNTRWIDNESKPGTDHDALDKNGNLNPTGHALRIWGNFLGKQMVKTEEALAAIVSYSSYSPEADKLYVYLINKTEVTHPVDLIIAGYVPTRVASSWEYFGSSPDDMSPVWKKRKKSSLEKTQTLRGSSITIYEVNIKPIGSED